MFQLPSSFWGASSTKKSAAGC